MISENAPRIEIRYVEGCNDDPENCGYILVSVNGCSQPSIFFQDFDAGDDAKIHLGLLALIESVYAKGFHDGEIFSKNKVKELIDWAKAR
jgi:hypothetical protein